MLKKSKIFVLIFLLSFQFSLFSENNESHNFTYNSIDKLDKLNIRIFDAELTNKLSGFSISKDDIPDNFDSFYAVGGYPIFACEKEILLNPDNITNMLLFETYFMISLNDDLTLQFTKLLEENQNKYIAITKDKTILGYSYTDYCYIQNNRFVFYPTDVDKVVKDDFYDEVINSAVMVIDGRKKITDFINIPFYTNMENTIKLLDERNLDYKIYQKNISIYNIKYNNKTISECCLSFSFDKLYSFEAKFEEEFSNEPSLDEYVDEYVQTFKMIKDEDEFIFPEYISCSGINLIVNKRMGTSIQLFDKEISDIVYEIKENKEAPLGYNKWSVSRFKLLANDYINEKVMFDTMRIYDLSDDGNYITLIDYYDNSIKVRISTDSKTKELIDRILYLHEQRQIYHATNCFADYYGYVGKDDNNSPVFFIEMID